MLYCIVLYLFYCVRRIVRMGERTLYNVNGFAYWSSTVNDISVVEACFPSALLLVT